MAEALTPGIAALAGSGVLTCTPLQGGDLSAVYDVQFEDGRRCVAKTGPDVETEARMLQAMGATGCPVPGVIATEPGLLLIDHLQEAPASATGWQAAGHALARLHGDRGSGYGWPEDYAFGRVAIPNSETDDWPAFWAARRLLAAPEAMPSNIARRLETLATRLPDLLPRTPPAAFLHGDLWAGNILFTATGAALIDPACYRGDAEVDLAMLHLFGAPGPAFAEAYGPLTPGWQARRPIYQLWPALVHLRLFGAGYLGMVDRLLAACGV